MGAFRTFLYQHPWQRRMLTLLLALVLGAAAGMVGYPYVRNTLLLRDLASENPAVRSDAIVRAAAWARYSPRTLHRLEDALDTDNDRQFSAIVAALRQAGLWGSQPRDSLLEDRMLAIELATTRSPSDPNYGLDVRLILFTQLLREGHDNRYVRQALATAADDPAVVLRARSAALAARLGGDAVLEKLLDDKSPRVIGDAAIAAGLAGRTELVGLIEKTMTSQTKGESDSGRLEIVSGCAYGLALLAPEKFDARLPGWLETSDEKLRDRLMWIAAMRNDTAAEEAVEQSLVADKIQFPYSAATLLAAGRLKIASAGPMLRETLKSAVDDKKPVATAELMAALQAADVLQLPVRGEVNAICRKLWRPDYPLLFATAANALGRQAVLDQPGDVTRDDAVDTLRRCALYVYNPPTTQPAVPQTTPLSSAVAGVALWRIAPSWQEYTITKTDNSLPVVSLNENNSAHYVRWPTRSSESLPGDIVAWGVGRSGRPKQAMELGLAMLPALDAPSGMRVYNKNEKCAGAMLLALAAETSEQKKAAVERITSRLNGGSAGPEQDPLVAGTYHCALLILGQRDSLPQVRELLVSLWFPRRRVITAMCAAGEKQGLDWLLLNPHVGNSDLEFMLTTVGLAGVIAPAAPDLPRVDAAAGPDVLAWQIRILRAGYVIRRADLRVELQP